MDCRWIANRTCREGGTLQKGKANDAETKSVSQFILEIPRYLRLPSQSSQKKIELNKLSQILKTDRKLTFLRQSVMGLFLK